MYNAAAVNMAVLQILHPVTEHDRGGAAIAIDKRYARVGMACCQHRLGDRQDRGDTGPGSQQQNVIGRAFAAVDMNKAPLRRHHIDTVTNRQTGERVTGKTSALDMLDPNPQHAAMRRRADRIGTAHLGAVNPRAQGQILPGKKTIGLGKVIRHGEPQRHGEIAEPLEMADRQLVEFRRHAGRVRVISEAFEIVKGFAAGQAAILRLAGGGAKGGQLGRIKAVTARAGNLRPAEIAVILPGTVAS